MEDLTHTALIPLPADGGELALPEALIERAKDYMAESLSERTREAYARWWRVFTAWCTRHGRQALPASPETIAGLDDRARRRRGRRAWAGTGEHQSGDLGNHAGPPQRRAHLRPQAPRHRHDVERHQPCEGHDGGRAPGVPRGGGRRARPAHDDRHPPQHRLPECRSPDPWLGRRYAQVRADRPRLGAARHRHRLRAHRRARHPDHTRPVEGLPGQGRDGRDPAGRSPRGLRGPGGLGTAGRPAARRADLPGGQQPPPDRRRAPHGAQRLAYRQEGDARPRPPAGQVDGRGQGRWCAGSPATRSGPATPPAPRRPTCRRCASSSTPGTSRPTWWPGTCGSRTSGRSPGSRASCIALRVEEAAP